MSSSIKFAYVQSEKAPEILKGQGRVSKFADLIAGLKPGQVAVIELNGLKAQNTQVSVKAQGKKQGKRVKVNLTADKKSLVVKLAPADEKPRKPRKS